MKRPVLIAIAALSLTSASALAADIMPMKAAPAPVAAPLFNWSGFYAGGNAGAVWSHLTTTDVDGFAAGGTPGTQTNLHHTGFTGGGQFGYNIQSGNFVYGIEADIGWMGLGKKSLITGSVSNTQVGVDSGLYGDVTGRIGYVVNNSLWYAKGGWAFYDANPLFSTTAGFTANNNLGTYSGWTAGAGVEWLIGQNWTAKIEYQHFDFGRAEFTLAPAVFRFDERLRAEVVKIGLNYKFGDGGKSPVVAKY